MERRYMHHRGIGNAAFVAALLGAAFAAWASEPAISVEAKQRYPWNGLVDLQFTITGTSGTKYDTSFTAKDLVGGTNITMKTLRKADGAAANVAKESLLHGDYHWVWDAAADLPDGWQSDRVTVTGTAVKPAPKYLIIDVSGGTSASKYATSYSDSLPSGKWGDYDVKRTTKLVLRYIEPGSFLMNGKYNVKITKPFYIGIYEVTQKQYGFVTDRYPSFLTGSWGYPVFAVSWEDIRGVSSTYNWPSKTNVDSKSFMGLLRAKTGLNFDLPTEAQWEYACRAGTESKYNNGGNAESDLKVLGFYGNANEVKVVGSYNANAWGLYDMHGNRSEWCLDWYGTLADGANPPGPSSGTKRVIRGGASYDNASGCTSSARTSGTPSAGYGYNGIGFRVCLTLSK